MNTVEGLLAIHYMICLEKLLLTMLVKGKADWGRW